MSGPCPFAQGYADGYASPDDLTTGRTWTDDPDANEEYDRGANAGQSAARRDRLRASVVMDCYAETANYDTDYDVGMETVGRHHHGPLVRFTGTRGNLRRMVAECWTLALSFEDGEPTLTDLEWWPEDAEPIPYRITDAGRMALTR